MDKAYNTHISVLLQEVIANLPSNLDKDSLKVFDGTLGGGGHTKDFLNLGCKVYSSDLDQKAIDLVVESLDKDSLDRFIPKNTNFSDYIKEFELNFFDYILLDLGYSSNQLEYSERGFSYQKSEDVLDLRYDQNNGIPAWKKINRLKSEKELGKIIYEYSGEQFAGKASKAIFDLIKSAEDKKITVGQVVEVVTNSIPKKFQNKKNAILSRVWQALRIWVNDEFVNLEEFLKKALPKLKIGGRLAIISFHSLEDKIVANFMRKASKLYEVDDFGNKQQDYKLLTKKAITPSIEEIEQNVRSRSALLRVIERVR